MKTVCVMVFFVGCCSPVFSQTFKEWFQQKKTQTEYLLKQIAALQVYIGYVEKGYQIANKGLTTIGDIKDGHLRRDQAFFRALDMVSPTVKGYDKIAAIVAMEAQVLTEYKAAVKVVGSSGQYTGKESDYIQTVYQSLIGFCASLLDDLIAVTSDDVLQMSDGERIERIDKIYLKMQDCYSFATHFRNECQVMAVQRAKEQHDAQLGRKLYGLPD